MNIGLLDVLYFIEILPHCNNLLGDSFSECCLLEFYCRSFSDFGFGLDSPPVLWFCFLV